MAWERHQIKRQAGSFNALLRKPSALGTMGPMEVSIPRNKK